MLVAPSALSPLIAWARVGSSPLTSLTATSAWLEKVTSEILSWGSRALSIRSKPLRT